LDNRGSHFYLALYWSEALAAQTEDAGLQQQFRPVAAELAANRAAIIEQLNAVQGQPVDLGGYYHPDPVKTERAMRPSPIFNAVINRLLQ
jgi:isocitrate dehydrogenase